MGKTNVGVPQGSESPLSPVVFLIYMAPILEEMEGRLSRELRLEVEVPSYVDDMLVCITDPKGRRNIRAALEKADTIMNGVAERWRLPLEAEKHEKLVFNRGGPGSGRRKTRSEVGRFKWLGIIVDEDLQFDHHWKSWLGKARKMLGALNGIGRTNWGISPYSWRQFYTGMVRTIALWGAEIGWRGQREWETQFERLQYVVLRKCTGAIISVNHLAGVEDVGTILEARQTRYMARCMCNPTTTMDIWNKALSSKVGRHWTDFSGPWIQYEKVKKKDGYESIANRLLSKLEVEERETISWGEVIRRFTVKEVDLGCTTESPRYVWQAAIDVVSSSYTPIYIDESMSEEGIVGGGYYCTQGTLGIRVGPLATVWDGEIAGLERGLKAAGEQPKVLLLADSKAAIQAVNSAGKTGKARTRALAALGKEIYRRLEAYGQGAVAIGWVKSHIGVEGNEKADEAAKLGASKDTGGEVTEGGVTQAMRELRKENRRADGILCVADWDRHAATTYSHLRTGKRDLQTWRFRLGKGTSPICKNCGTTEETGEHIVFQCPKWEDWRVKRLLSE